MKPETWFLLYKDNGKREVYAGRTTDVDVARDFYEKCEGNRKPHGRWGVRIITPEAVRWANSGTEWDKL